MKSFALLELEHLRDALVSGFNRNELTELAAFSLDIDLDAEIDTNRGTRSIAFELLKFTQRQGWTEALLRHAVNRRPKNPTIARLAYELGLAPTTFSGRNAGFQALILEHSTSQSIGRFTRLQVECERAVCQIRRGGARIGTGFLVAPGLVMTNWHVFQDNLGGALGPSEQYRACFDFRGADDGTVADEGIEVPFAVNAVRDASHREELDYVIVELVEKEGDSLLPDGRPRGFLKLGTREFEVDEAAIILQHPAERTLEVAVGVVTGWHRDGSVFKHKIETDNGSSGSPCFAPDWSLLGLHHRFDLTTGDHNRGIATSAILSRMGAITPPTIGLLPAV